ALNRPSRENVSFHLQSRSLQWVLVTVIDFYGVPGCGIRTPPLRKEEFFQAPSMQQPREAIISFVAARLVIDSVLLVVLPGELLLDGPWPRPNRRIFDRDRVFKRAWPSARPTLDQMQVLA